MRFPALVVVVMAPVISALVASCALSSPGVAGKVPGPRRPACYELASRLRTGSNAVMRWASMPM
jgi:hypothetical protein